MKTKANRNGGYEVDATWTEECLDTFVITKVTVTPASVQTAFRAKIAEVKYKNTIPGFRIGRAADFVIRQRYGKKILEALRQEFVLKTFDAVAKDMSLKYNVDAAKLPAPIEVRCSEESGFYYEIHFRSEVKPATQPTIDVVDGRVRARSEHIQDREMIR